MVHVLFSSNTPIALFCDDLSDGSFIDDCTFSDHTGVVIRITGTVQFVCPLGYYMIDTGDYSGGDFTGCAFPCGEGFYADPAKRVCYPCHATCKTCSGPRSSRRRGVQGVFTRDSSRLRSASQT